MERTGQYTLKGGPLTLVGPELKAGDAAPEFTAFAGLGKIFDSKDIKGKVRFINVVPSVDTGICDAQTKRFSDEANKITGVDWITISCDAPTALNRWCSAGSITNLRMLSDFRDHDFGTKYGVYVKEQGLLQRSIFIVGANDKIAYVQRVAEMASHPDYDAALAALKGLVG
ncbi:MAG TPA: thiol peroxidase [bacterium]|jgi:thiol peroxidase|nr:thiol peroxidase [bacterium]